MTKKQDKILKSGSDTILFAHQAFNYIENQQYDQALELCESGVKRFPFYAEGHFILGKCYQAQKNYNDAKSEYERTLMFMPGHIRALNALAYIYHKIDMVTKANELLIQASLYNPLNSELIGYLKAENLYNGIYETSDTTMVSEPSAQEMYPDSERHFDDDITEELISEINDLMPESTNELDGISAQAENWEKEADQIDPQELLPFNISDDELEDSTIQFEDSKIVDFEKDNTSDLEDSLSLDFSNDPMNNKSVEDGFNSIESELSDLAETDLDDSSPDRYRLEDSTIDDSFMDDSFIQDNSSDEFFLEPDDTSNKNYNEDEITRIDEFALSKDENTELSIDQYEVNNIVDNIVESDFREETKTDLSKFANTEDDFSTLMNGIFEDQDYNEIDEDPADGIMTERDEDDTRMAEERPILDTSIIFMDRDRSDTPEVPEIEEGKEPRQETDFNLDNIDLEALEKPGIPKAKEVEEPEQETGFNLDDMDLEGLETPEIPKVNEVEESEQEIDFNFDEDEEEINFDNSALMEHEPEDFELEEDEISKVIDKIEKKGDKLITKDTAEKEDKKEVNKEPKVEELPSIEDEDASIEEILGNPKMLTSTFGEILIAQKKFGDAQRVFTELSKKDPGNNHLKRKIEFLNKLVKFEK